MTKFCGFDLNEIIGEANKKRNDGFEKRLLLENLL